MVGVGIMIGLLVAILAWEPDDRTAPVSAPPAASVPPAPSLPPVEAPPPPSPAVSPSPSPSPSKKDDRNDVTGRYRVLSSYGDSFIAEVLVTNASSGFRSWTVTLVFPDGVPQPTLRRSGQRYTFTSAVPIPPKSSIELKFDFSRSGRNNNPASCRTNGVTCR
jgi:hypothetical protein